MGLRLCATTLLVLLFATTSSADSLVVDNVANVDENFQTVFFPGGSFATTPVVFALGPNDTTGSLIRVRNVTPSGFEIAHLVANNSAGGSTTPSDVAYFAVEPGTGTIGGLSYVAGTHTTSTLQHGTGVTGAEGYDTVAYGATINSPVLGAFVQTMNDASVATLSTAIDTGSVSTTDFDLALERAEDNGGTPGASTVAETIGFFAIETGNGTFMLSDGTTITFDFFNTGDAVDGVDDSGVSVGFNAAFTSDPLVVGNLVTHDGADGGWLSLMSIALPNFVVGTNEDEANDGERNHTTEAAAIFAFSQAFSTLAVPEPTSIAIWSLLALGCAGFLGWRRSRKM